MAGYKLLWGTDALTLKDGGEVYHVGDTVPVTEDQVKSLRTAGIMFEGVEYAVPGETSAVEALKPATPKP